MSEDRAEHNMGRDGENIEFTAESTGDYTIYISGTGTENATTKYLNKGSLGTGFTLRPSANVGIVTVGTKTYRNPISVSTAGFSQHKHLRDFQQIVIRVDTANTLIKLFVT
jgi:hypothetical protein